MDITEKFGLEKCESCSKEAVKGIPVQRIINKLDSLFSKNDLSEAGRLLEYWEGEARASSDERGLITILDEEIGYYRRTGEREKGLAAVKEAFSLLEAEEYADSVSTATIYVNGATTMKAFGGAKDSLPYYDMAHEIYLKHLPSDSFLLAALYNNMASAYSELKNYGEAKELYEKAISVLKMQNESVYNGEIAVSLLNIAQMMYEKDPCGEEAYEYAQEAYSYLTQKPNVHDGNYAFILSKCAPTFGYLGYFKYEKELSAESERIYEGN